MIDWQVGDLALCVDDSPPKISPSGLVECRREYNNNLRAGSLYTITQIVFAADGSMGIADMLRRAGGYHFRFVKVTPPESDEFDREVIDQLAGVPA